MSQEVVDHWLAPLTPTERERALPVVEAILHAAPEMPIAIQGTMLGFGPFCYRYESGRAGETAKLAVATRAHGISVYVNCLADGDYLLAKYVPKIGKASAGKSCLRFRRFSDLNADAFAALVREAADSAGPGSVN